MKRALMLLTILTLSLLPRPAIASCAAMPGPELANMAQVIVSGKVTRFEQPAKGGTYVTVTVDRVYKGAAPNPLLIYSQSGRGQSTSVDYDMREGEAHTLYLRLGEGGGFFTTNICTGSHPGQPTADEVKLLGEGAPAPAPEVAPPAAASTPPVRIWVPIISFTVALGAVAAVIFLPRLLRKQQ